jgi:cell division septation protein DedD
MKMWGWAALAAMAGTVAPAAADVKTGVDAWQQGDYAKAVTEWRPLAEGGDPDAQFNLGQAYKLGRGVPANLDTALGWYRKAAAQGHLRAEDNLGLLMFQQGDRAAAMPMLQRAAGRGEPRAQYIVGTALFNGDLLPKDWVRAYALMTRASASGLQQAATSLEQMDKYIPEDQRKKGLALAAGMESGTKDAALAAASPAPARSAPSAIRPVDLPPSTPARPAPAPARPPVKVASAPAPTPARPAVAATPAPAPSGGWRVQLGAFGEEGRARALWSQLKGKVGGLSAYQPYLVKAGTVTRLQAGPVASAADAARLCGAIKAAGSDCMPKKM